MHRSITRRDDVRNTGRGALPPGKAPHGQATPTTETIPRPEKSSRKSRPLSSSTNKRVPDTESTARLSCAPSQQWKTGRSPTPGPPDENDDWILNQQAPPLPSMADRPRSRTRTCSAGGSKHKAKSEEKKSRSFLTQDDTAIAIQSGRSDRVALEHRRITDAQASTARADHDGGSQDRAASLKRRISWGRNKKSTPEEAAPEDFNYKRASQLGLPGVEKELVPSLRDTIYKMTGEHQRASNDGVKHSSHANNSHERSVQNFSIMLSPPSVHERPKSALSVRSPSSLPSTETVLARPRQRTHSSRARIHYDENVVVDHESHQKEETTPNVEGHEPFVRPAPSHEASEVKSGQRTSLKTPRPVKVSQNLSPNMDADDSGSEAVLRTPRVRSSPRSRVSPLLSASTSPARMPSSIPTPKLRSRSSSTTTRANKSPSLPQASANKSPRTLNGSRSPAVPSDAVETGSRSHQPSNISDRFKPNTRLLTPKTPLTYCDEDADETPKASRVAWYREQQSSSEGDSTSDEKLRTVDRPRYSQSQSRSASSRRSPNPAHSIRREQFASASPNGGLGSTRADWSASDLSEHEISRMTKTQEDPHLRRKNELVNLVAGLNLDLSPQDYGRVSNAGYRGAKRDVSQEQSDYSPRQDDVGIAMGGSSELADFKESPKLMYQVDVHGRRNQDTNSNGQDEPYSRRGNSQKRLSSTPRPNAGDPTDDVINTKNFLKPDSRNVNRDSLLMLNADRQREAFGIPPSVSDVREGGEMLSSAESNTSLKNQTLDSEWEGEAADGLGLSHGAEQLFHRLGIGADAQHGDSQFSTRQRASWRSSMAEAEKYLSENIRPAPGSMSTSSSTSSIYEDDVPDRPWQKRERDLDRVQSVSGNSIKSSWKKTLSQSAYISLLDRHGETEMRRQEVIWELCETEQAFLKSLRTALKVFVNPLLGKNRQWVSGLPSNVSRLLDWLEDIFQLHAQISSALQHARSSQYPVVLRIAETLRTFVPRLEVYQPYIVRLDDVVGDIEKIMKDTNNDLGEFFRIQSSSEDCAGMSFSSFLWLPLTRLGRYLKHFNELWILTPRSHVDHLPTFSLLHSATMVVRVMREVKLREEEHSFVKELLSRVRGFPKLMHLVRRERRLIAHGTLQRVHVSERAKDILDGSSPNPTSRHDVRFEHSRRSTKSAAQRRRANSLDSCLSEASSMSSICSAASDSSLNREGALQHNFGITAAFNAGVVKPLRHFITKERAHGTYQEKTRTTSLYVFVFDDLAVFTSIPSHCSNDGKGQNALELLDDIGICRVLSVTDHSGNLGYDHLVGVHILPVDIEQLDNVNVLSDGTATCLFVHLPKARSSAAQHSDARKRWWNALEECYHFTLRSLSFPAHTGRYLAYAPGADRNENTRETVMGILASGLPLPKSPSVQIGEVQKIAAEDASLREREERGWWALRFQQILHEIQRDNLHLSLQRTSSMLSPSVRRKTVSGRRRLKLASARK